MNLFEFKEHHFSYFNNIHITSLIVCLILLGIIFILLPYFYSERQKRFFEIIMGYFILFHKAFDTFYLVVVEQRPFLEVLPLHLCNVSLIICGLYFITRKRIFFNIVYFYSFGAIIAVLLPGIGIHYTNFYVYMFMSTHILEMMIVFYGFIHNNETITFKGLLSANILYIIMILVAYVVNMFLDTNYMYITDYVIGAVSFMNIWAYRIVYVLVYMLIMLTLYIPFANLNTTDIEENII